MGSNASDNDNAAVFPVCLFVGLKTPDGTCFTVIRDAVLAGAFQTGHFSRPSFMSP